MALYNHWGPMYHGGAPLNILGHFVASGLMHGQGSVGVSARTPFALGRREQQTFPGWWTCKYTISWVETSAQIYTQPFTPLSFAQLEVK
jgi:hypothetical protein